MIRHAYSISGLALALALLSLGCGDGDFEAGGGVSFGGAQDIGQFRSIVESGGIPGENTLDANGFFNEHQVDLPPSECQETLCLRSMLSVGENWVTGEYQATVQLSMTTPVDPAGFERKPLDLVVVVDTSGSMNEDDRIGFVKQGLHLLVDQIEEGDRLALVSYNSVVDVHSELGEPLDREALHTEISTMFAAGGTNFHDGLQRGFELAAAAMTPERQARVIMLSDGLPTVGVIGGGAIIAMANEHIGTGIGLTTIGVGQDFNVDLMRSLAERGAGNFYFLEDPSAVDEVFTEELDYFVTPLALGVSLGLTTAPGYDLGEVLGTRLWKTDGNAGDMFVPAVFLASRTGEEPGEGRRGGGSALFIDVLPAQGLAASSEIGDVQLTYRLPDTGEVFESVASVENPSDPAAVLESPYFSHEAMSEQYAIYNIFLGLREASRVAESFSHSCALAHLQTIDKKAARWNFSREDPDIAADRALIAQLMSNLRAHGALDAEELGGDPCRSGHGTGDEYYEDEYYGCSAAPGGGAGAALLLILALPFALRRRFTVAGKQ